MKTYKFSEDGYFIGIGEAYENPKLHGSYLYDLRRETLTAPNLPVSTGKRAFWNGSTWSEVDIEQSEIDDIERESILKSLSDLDMKQIRSVASLLYAQVIQKPEDDRNDDEKKLVEFESAKETLRNRKRILDGE